MKRCLDFIAALVALVVLSPLMAAVALALAVTMGRPVLFRQRRPGLHGRIFTVDKFRTMNGARGPDGELLPDAQRLTRVGRLIRAASLDELPQFWNVLRGDMSLVGPRPLLPEYLEKVQSQAVSPARSQTGYYRLGANQRPQRAELG